MQKSFNMKTGITFDEVVGDQEEIKQIPPRRIITGQELSFRLGKIITEQKRQSAANNGITMEANNTEI